jgi:hypothetical protein
MTSVVSAHISGLIKAILSMVGFLTLYKARILFLLGTNSPFYFLTEVILYFQIFNCNIFNFESTSWGTKQCKDPPPRPNIAPSTNKFSITMTVSNRVILSIMLLNAF